ncbi:hypothetical protein [Bdellovibrio svalbardensis]|uniref:Uncharacterized protein n=1 Tax=Bdellovibrio svalbardensis TaxID=2972972 RepID=A0ABT6DPN7_9BACT|nr:hypothetical protein [Bdellovibrio svalbardensis]MDG0817879.1 hypothetical protein [Bdellovibrio svalbardensis]
MLKNSKTPIIIGTSIPLTGYLLWLVFFTQQYHGLKDLADKDAILNFVVVTSAVMACFSLIVHIGFALFFTNKLADSLIEIQNLNERIQGLTEDLSEIANYNQNQVSEVISNISIADPRAAKAHSNLNILNEAAEEMSIRADKTAFEIQRLDNRIKSFFAEDANPKTRGKLSRKWESAYFFK